MLGVGSRTVFFPEMGLMGGSCPKWMGRLGRARTEALEYGGRSWPAVPEECRAHQGRAGVPTRPR